MLTRNEKKPSLFPYIKAGNNAIQIDFLPAVRPRDKKKPAFPFETFQPQEHSDPLATLVKARLVTDAGSEIEQLAILLQRDRVQHLSHASFPADNPATAQCWQRAFNHYSNNERFDDCLIKLGVQLTNDGHLQPFQPLFYCIYKKVFFPPPCPLCGGELDLCDDDEMLTAADLHPYTHSLRRYLFCPTCYQLAGETDFYTSLSQTPDENNAKTAVELINGFKKLTTSTSMAHRFPCHSCPEISDCHTQDGPLLSRISPIAFYPFHMLIFKADLVSPDILSIFNVEKHNLSPSPKAKPVPAPPAENPDKSILVILKHLIGKWERDLANNGAKPSWVEKTGQPSISPGNNLFSESAIPALELNNNPDLQETIIVSTNRKRSPADKKPYSLINGDMPETIIAGTINPNQATKSIRTPPPPPTKRHPGSTVEDNHRPLSLIERAMVPQVPDNLPETMIIRPHEPKPNAQTTRNPVTSTDDWPKQPNQSGQQDGRSNKNFSFNIIHSTLKTNSFLLGKEKHMPAPEPENPFLKTFTLDSGKNNPNHFKKEGLTPSKDQNTPPVSSRLDTEDNLAETIIVSPPKKDKDGN